MAHYRIDFSYDGSQFHGYASQPGQRTVQGELEKALIQVGRAAETAVAGRTDAGVHARCQVVSATLEREIKPERLHNALNQMLPDDMGVQRVSEADPGFNARFDAKSRTYRYFVLQDPWHDPFRRHTHWQIDVELDMSAMNAGAALLVGEHDFASFCRRAEGRSTIREIMEARWYVESPRVACFDVKANAFCHQMVRSIVAVLVNVGLGNIPSKEVTTILEARDRRFGRGAAPPQGLYLWSVEY